jgi:capsular polysaccharide biosynthesis protein
LATAQAFTKSDPVASKTYTAEATIYLFAGISEKDVEFNYALNEARVVESARRVVTSDSVAGEVRRSYQGKDPSLTIASPYVYDTELAQRVGTNFIFVDATSADPQIALAAANEAAEQAIEKIGATFSTVDKVELYEEAILKSSATKNAAELGSDALTSVDSTGEVISSTSLLDRLSKKTLALAFLIGLFGAAFCFCAYEILNRKIRNARDAEVLTGVPVIAQLPDVDRLSGTKTLQELGIIVSDIQVSLANSDKKAVGIASIVDPQLSRISAKLLADEIEKRGIKVALVAQEESEPISLAKQQELIEEAIATHDLVVVDAGAIATGADAVAIAAATGMVLLATQEHRASNRQIKRTIRQLQLIDVPLLGIALFTGKRRFAPKKG